MCDAAKGRKMLEHDPQLLELAELARSRLAAKLGYLEADGVTLGRKPWWWQEGWP